MKTTSMMLCLVLIGLLASPAPAHAQTASAPPSIGDWSNLSAVVRGVELVVKLKNGKTAKGRLSNVTDTTLVLERKGKTNNIASADVAAVHRVIGKSSKAKWAGIGAGIGLAAGAGVAVAAGADDNNDLDPGLIALLTVPLGAGVGALIGTVVGAGKRKRELVYETRTAGRF